MWFSFGPSSASWPVPLHFHLFLITKDIRFPRIHHILLPFIKSFISWRCAGVQLLIGKVANKGIRLLKMEWKILNKKKKRCHFIYCKRMLQLVILWEHCSLYDIIKYSLVCQSKRREPTSYDLTSDYGHCSLILCVSGNRNGIRSLYYL